MFRFKDIQPSLTICFSGLLALAMVGCGGKDKDKQTSESREPQANQPSTTTDTPTTPGTTTEPHASDWKAAPTTTQQAQTTPPEKQPETQDQPPTVIRAQSEPPTQTGDAPPLTKEEQRQLVNDAIYAQIRLQMEQAIAERKQLLDGGTPPSDEKVRHLEGKIMKARELLIENGEFVDDVEPPIVQTQP